MLLPRLRTIVNKWYRTESDMLLHTDKVFFLYYDNLLQYVHLQGHVDEYSF